MVEMALAFPILLLILAGTLEVGKYFNDYLTILDATREAARYAADGDLVLMTEPSSSCDDNFFHQAACLAMQNVSGIAFDKTTDDVVVSAMSVGSNGKIIARYPRASSDPPLPPGAEAFLPDYRDALVSSSDEGWSYCEHITKTDCKVTASRFSNQAIEDMLKNSPNGPGTGIVIVEIYRLHRQFLGLIPPGLAFLPQEVVMYAYSMMPVPSAAPPPSYTP
jgi:hypothetical protein